MTEEALTDDERLLVLVFMTKAYVDARFRLDGLEDARECLRIIDKLSGVDVQVVCRKKVGGRSLDVVDV